MTGCTCGRDAAKGTGANRPSAASDGKRPRARTAGRHCDEGYCIERQSRVRSGKACVIYRGRKMALIDCSECGKQVSERAASCPHCGNPIASRAAVLPPAALSLPNQVYTEDSKPVTTQQTGKGPKTIQLIGLVLILAGMVSDRLESARDRRTARHL
jgi:hypothetical protein